LKDEGGTSCPNKALKEDELQRDKSTNLYCAKDGQQHPQIGHSGERIAVETKRRASRAKSSNIAYFNWCIQQQGGDDTSDLTLPSEVQAAI